VRDVAKQVDRRRMRRKATLWTTLLALIVAAAAYLRCGGFGLGTGKGDGGDEATATAPPQPLAGPRRCAIRVTASGITVNGKPMQRDEAVDACKATTGADVIVTGDAREGNWTDLRSALEASGVKDIVVHQPSAGSGAR
jgi:hypothetical protein